MAHKNLEEAMVDRIHRAIVTEWKRLCRPNGPRVTRTHPAGPSFGGRSEQ